MFPSNSQTVNSEITLKMCYVVITCRSLAWFLLTIVTDLFILTAMVTPKWLIGPQPHIIDDTMLENATMHRYPSVGINTRLDHISQTIFILKPRLNNDMVNSNHRLFTHFYFHTDAFWWTKLILAVAHSIWMVWPPMIMFIHCHGKLQSFS